jgi:exodeoxyribonuclease-5
MVKHAKHAPLDREVQRNELTKGLSQGQADALMLMIEFLTIKGPDMFVLKGYAGTGKTFIVKKLIDYITNKYHGSRIAVTAPTNKAVHVLLSRRDFRSNFVTYQTIHSLLGLTETINANGVVTFTTKKGNSGEMDKIRFLIVDETSMLQDDIFKMLEKYSSTVKIIFMGDPAQIPPVGRVDCIPFKRSLSTHYEEGYTLTEIMRQAKGNPIIEASFILRDNLGVANPIPVLETRKDDDGHGLTWIDSSTDKDGMLMLLESHFVSSKFKDNPDYAKLIAWRNRTVASANSRIRGMIYGDEELKKIMPGEKLLANKPIFDEDGAIIFNTSEEFTIESYKIIDKKVVFGSKILTVKIYDCTLDKSSAKLMTNKIKVLHEDSEADYAKMLEELKQKAIAEKDKSRWVTFYDALKWPADIAYNYAITAHKAQGSTYENVFLMEDDLNANPNIVERNRIKYTSYSRASKKLYVYRSNPF